jgi:hypothetical protein
VFYLKINKKILNRMHKKTDNESANTQTINRLKQELSFVSSLKNFDKESYLVEKEIEQYC